MIRRALVIAHEVDGGGGLVTEALHRRGLHVDTHLVCDDYRQPNVANAIPAADGYDLLVPMGSVRSLTAKGEIDSWIHDELELVRSCHASGTPVLGVCFGGQLLAEALGGSVEQADAGEFGWLEIEPPDNPVGPGPWMQWHHDRFTPPPGAEVLATSDRAVQLFRVGRSVGTQFHPEVDTAHVAGWLQVASDGYLAEIGLDRTELLRETEVREPANREQCFALVDWFLDTIAPG